jgi:hypothetical protein
VLHVGEADSDVLVDTLDVEGFPNSTLFLDKICDLIKVIQVKFSKVSNASLENDVASNWILGNQSNLLFG